MWIVSAIIKGIFLSVAVILYEEFTGQQIEKPAIFYVFVVLSLTLHDIICVKEYNEIPWR